MIEINHHFAGFITNIVDADTVDIVLDLQFHISMKQRLRLARIDAPELRSPLTAEREKAKLAREYVIEKALAKKVIVATEKADSFGRYLAEVYIVETGENLNDALLEAGHAVGYLKR